MPKNQLNNLSIYTDLGKAYQEAIGYFKATRLVDDDEDSGLENYQSKIFGQSEVVRYLQDKQEEGDISPKVLVATEADLKIWTKEIKSILIQMFPQNAPLY